MVQITQLPQKAPSGFKLRRKVKLHIRRRKLRRETFNDFGRTFPDLGSEDGDSGDESEVQRTGKRAKPEKFLGFSPCWEFRGSGRWMRLACRKFLFRPKALVSWIVNTIEREKEPVENEFSDCEDSSCSNRSEGQPEKERGPLKIATWLNDECWRGLPTHLIEDPEDAEEQEVAAKESKVDDRIGEGCYGCSGGRSWRSRSKSRKEAEVLGESYWKRRKQDVVANGAAEQAALPDDIIEMCLARTSFASLMRARAVCKKWKSLTSSPHFLHMRDNSCSLDPWLFLFGLSRNGVCLGQIQALDPTSSRWHTINASILTGRQSYSVISVKSVIYVVGGCTSNMRTGGSSRSNKESLKALKTVLTYTPITGSWKKVNPLTTERVAPIVGMFNISGRTAPWNESTCVETAHSADHNWASARCGRASSTCRRRKSERGSRGGGELAVYGGVEIHARAMNSVGGAANAVAMPIFPELNKCSQVESSVGVLEAEFKKLDVQGRRRTKAKEQTTFGLIAVGGQGAWNEQLDSAEIYDPVTDRWREIASLPADHGTSCAGVVCKNFFYVYSETNKLAAYDLEHDVWHSIRVSQDPARLLDYTPKLVLCRDRIFLFCVAWAMPSVGGSEMATREIWELRQEPESTGWVSVSQHPDAPLDWNATFVSDEERIFGVEMFKIFGQMLDFITVCKISGSGGMVWERLSRIEMALNGMDPSSCLTKTAVVVQL